MQDSNDSSHARTTATYTPPLEMHAQAVLAGVAALAGVAVASASESIWSVVNTDSPSCTTTNITSLIPPAPTGDVSSALYSWLSAQTTAAHTGRTLCDITTAIPVSVVSSYLAYGSSVSEWLQSSSAIAFDSQEECPLQWKSLNSVHVTDFALAIGCMECYERQATTAATAGTGLDAPATTTASTTVATASASPSASGSGPTTTAAHNAAVGRPTVTSLSIILLVVVVLGVGVHELRI